MSITVLKGIYRFGFIFFLCSSAYSFWRTRKIVRDFRELSESARKITARYDDLLMDLTMENLALKKRLGIRGPIGVPLELPLDKNDKDTVH